MKVEAQVSELIASQLWDRGTSGVYETENGEVVAGFESKLEADSTVAWLRTVAGVEPESVIAELAPTESDWAINTEPIVHNVKTGRHDFSIAITAEATFGHGGHPTTELALDLLLRSVHPGTRVLDLGTGSGVLAIAAAKAGAGSVSAIDIDHGAVSVAAKNAAANGVNIDCSTATVQDVVASAQQKFDLIVMNVLLPVHRELATDVLAALADGGTLITSGYLFEQSPELIALYTHGSEVTTVESAAANDWAAHTFVVAGER